MTIKRKKKLIKENDDIRIWIEETSHYLRLDASYLREQIKDSVFGKDIERFILSREFIQSMSILYLDDKGKK